MIEPRPHNRAYRIGMTLGVQAMLLSAPLSAQANPDSVQLRKDCRLAEQVLEAGHTASNRTHAITLIPRCGIGIAAPALAHVWADPPVNHNELQVLVTSTRDVVTPELVRTLLAAFQRTDLSTEQRVAALLVLVTYADSTDVPGFGHFIGPRELLLRQRYGGTSHPYTPVGHDKLPIPVRQQLEPVLEQLMTNDPNPDIRTAAQVALANLRR